MKWAIFNGNQHILCFGIYMLGCLLALLGGSKQIQVHIAPWIFVFASFLLVYLLFVLWFLCARAYHSTWCYDAEDASTRLNVTIQFLYFEIRSKYSTFGLTTTIISPSNIFMNIVIYIVNPRQLIGNPLSHFD